MPVAKIQIGRHIGGRGKGGYTAEGAAFIKSDREGREDIDNMIVVSVIGIILAFAVLIFAAYKKISMFLAAVLAAAIVALFGGLDVAASLVGADGPFLIGMKDFVGSWL